MKKFTSACLMLLLAGASYGQSVQLELKGNTEVVQVDKVIVVKEDRTVVKSFPFFVSAAPDIGFYRWTYPATTKAIDKGNVLQVDAAPKGDLTINLKVESAVVVDGKIKYITQFGSIIVAIGEVPGPIPPPDPKPLPPPDPKPVPVTSFHVIFVYESGKLYTPQQISVMDSKATRDYLAANTTPEAGYAGYRKYDKDVDSSKDAPTINAMWQATKPMLTTVPCVAIEANTKVEIVPLAATPEAMIEVFKSYKSGVK